jgi:hypothetical protein
MRLQCFANLQSKTLSTICMFATFQLNITQKIMWPTTRAAITKHYYSHRTPTNLTSWCSSLSKHSIGSLVFNLGVKQRSRSWATNPQGCFLQSTMEMVFRQMGLKWTTTLGRTSWPTRLTLQPPWCTIVSWCPLTSIIEGHCWWCRISIITTFTLITLGYFSPCREDGTLVRVRASTPILK